MDRQLYEDFNRVLNPHLYKQLNTQQLFEAFINEDEILLEQVLLEGRITDAVRKNVSALFKNANKMLPIILIAAGLVGACGPKAVTAGKQLSAKDYRGIMGTVERPEHERYNPREPESCINRREAEKTMKLWQNYKKTWSDVMPLKDGASVEFREVGKDLVKKLIYGREVNSSDSNYIYISKSVDKWYSEKGNIFSIGSFGQKGHNGKIDKRTLGVRVNCQNGLFLYLVPIADKNEVNRMAKDSQGNLKQSGNIALERDMNAEFIVYMGRKNQFKGASNQSAGAIYDSIARMGPEGMNSAVHFIKMIQHINKSWYKNNPKREERPTRDPKSFQGVR